MMASFGVEFFFFIHIGKEKFIELTTKRVGNSEDVKTKFVDVSSWVFSIDQKIRKFWSEISVGFGSVPFHLLRVGPQASDAWWLTGDRIKIAGQQQQQQQLYSKNKKIYKYISHSNIVWLIVSGGNNFFGACCNDETRSTPK